MRTISFTNHSVKTFSLDRRLLKKFLPVIFQEESSSFTKVDYIFCTDEYLLGLNKEFLDHDTYTDIVTFSLADYEEPIIAEIYISIDRIRDNAIELGNDFLEELHRVIIHGILHLCGYADHTTELKIEMTAKEDYYLEKLCST